MSAIQPPMMAALKNILEERFVSLLPNLAGPQITVPRQDKQISRAFNAFILQKLFDLPAEKAADCVVDEINDQGIDAFYYHESDETLYLVQGKLKASEDFKQEEAESFTRGIRQFVELSLEHFNQLFKNRETEIEYALDHCSHIQLVIAYTGSGVTAPARIALEQLVIDHTLDEDRFKSDILYVNAAEIEQYLRTEQSIRPVNTRLKLSHSNKLDSRRKTILGLIKVDDLVELHNLYDKALYQKNIRYFIGTNKRGVNKAIRDTLENRPEDFMHLNNGITAVCTGIDGKRTRGGVKSYDLAGLSIINGAQTISSAALFKDEKPEADTSAARVTITLIQASGNGSFHKDVTKARNLQNPVSLANFAALDETQERLRQEMALHGYEYRYRPEASRVTSDYTIEIDELSKALACLTTDIRHPARLKAEPGLFTQADSDEYQSLFTTTLNAYTAINSVIIFRIIREVLKSAEQSTPSSEKLIYRHGVYAIASILMKRLKDRITGTSLLDAATMRSDISPTLDTLRQQCADAFPNGRAQHAFFKKISDTAQYINRIMITHEGLGEEQTVQNLLGRQSSDDPYNQALNNYLSGRITQI